MYEINFSDDFNYYGHRNISYNPSKNSISILGQNTYNGFYGISKIKVNKYNPLYIKYKIIVDSSYNWDAGSGIGIYLMNSNEYSASEYVYYGAPTNKKIILSNSRQISNGPVIYRYTIETQNVYSNKSISYPYNEILVEIEIKDNHLIVKNNNIIFIDTNINMDIMNDIYYISIFSNNYNNSIIKFYDMSINNGLYFLSSRNKYYDVNDENYIDEAYKKSDISNIDYTILYDFCKIRDIDGEKFKPIDKFSKFKICKLKE